MAADARALMDHMGWESAHVVGHSMGGVIAQELALDTPLRVRSLTLMCTFVRGKDAAKPTPWVIWMSMRTRIGTRRMRRRAFLEMIATGDQLAGVDVDALAARVGSLVGRDLSENPAILMKQVGALSQHDTSARLGELADIPTLVRSAGHERIAPPSLGLALAAAIPGAAWVELSDRSHGMTILDPLPVNEWLARFLRVVEAERV
jgi:pimeloyl-ACP methyl ester carboxylesterase